VAGIRRAGCIEHRVGPVGEGTGRIGRPIRVVGLIAVGDRHPLPVPIQAGQGGEDVVRGVGDQRRVVVRQHRPVLLDEIQQVWHHLEVRRNVGVVAEEVHVVKRELDHVLHPVAESTSCPGDRAIGGSGA
jgi:hypothetical protein